MAESDDTSTTEVSENEVTVTVTLSADPERTVTIPITKVNQGGATSADYEGVPADVTFNAGDTSKTFTFRALHEMVHDDDESVKLTFGTRPARVSEGTTKETVVSINDDDVPPVTVSYEQDAYEVDEGDQVTVKVTLSADPERTVAIPVTKTNQGGAENADYSDVPASVTFNSGDTEKSFTLTATDDTLDDDDEKVRLGFGTMPFRVSAGTTGQSTVSINDDDDPEITVSYGAAAYDVPEGGAAEVSVTLSADPERDVTILITSTNQDGASDDDHSGIPASLDFSPSDTLQKFTVNGFQDDLDDGDESVLLTFGTLPARVTEGATNEAVVRITDDDVPHVKVDFADGTGTVLEGYNMGVKVVLDVDPERTVTVPIIATEQDGATHHDYSMPGSVTFNSGETEAYPVFNAIHDDIDESNERVVLTFGTPLPHRVTVGNPGMTDITITDDDGDGSAIQVGFRQGRHEVVEGDSADLTVVLSKAADADVTIELEGQHYDRIQEADYSGVPDSVQIARGETQATFTVTAVDDNLAEENETLAIRFRNLPSVVEVGPTFGSDFVIRDNDSTVRVFNSGCPPDSGDRIILERIGNIGQAGESDFWSVELDPWRVYIIEVLGVDSGVDVAGNDTHSGNLTLSDPELIALWNHDRSQRHVSYSPIARDGGHGRNSAVTDQARGHGTHQFEVQGNGGTGTYQIKVRVNNLCTLANGYEQYPWFGGPDGYVLDIPANTSTNRILRPHEQNVGQKATGGFLGDNWDWYWNQTPDEDWIAAELQTGYEYTVELWTDESYPSRHQATQLTILGVQDPDGEMISGTASDAAGNRVSVTFQPDACGTHHIRVGSGENDRTGDYNISINATPEGDNPCAPGQVQLQLTGGPEGNSPAQGEPRVTGELQVGQTVTADTSGISDPDGLEDAAFGYQWIVGGADVPGATGETYTLQDGDRGLVVQVLVTFTDDDGNPEAVPSRPTEPVTGYRNRPASGQVAIAGNPDVGESLEADTSGISDPDGMENASFSYQWTAGGNNIPGATQKRYVVDRDDEGLLIQVWVSFTDDAGNPEAAFSTPAGPVTDTPLTAAFSSVPESHNGEDSFTLRVTFSHTLLMSFAEIRDHSFQVAGGSVTGARRVSGLKEWEIQVTPDGDGDVVVTLPGNQPCVQEGAICLRGSKRLSNSLQATVPGPS